MRVGVVGAAGRMGRQVCEALAGADDLDLVAALDPAAAGTPLRSLVDAAPDLVILGSPQGLLEAGCAVVVDFTLAGAARVQIPWYAEHGVHAVVGTSGLTDEDLAAASRAFAASSANAVIAANFAIGAALLVRFSELAAAVMDSAEVIELHHDAKVDAPSGTALHTAKAIAAGRGDRQWAADPTTALMAEGVRGGLVDGVRVHSIRLPGLVAHEEVVFGALGQSLSIRHDSYDRRSFMPGVLLAVRVVADRPGLTLGLGPLLGF
jgi:4-hydroxy-tetrahydrodipicolinate reductase